MKILYLIIFATFFSCSSRTPEKKFNTADVKTVYVSDKIIDFETDQIIKRPHLTIQGEYFIVTDLSTLTDRGILLYNKNSLEYITRTGVIGEGPGEIIKYGLPATSYKKNEFWMPDFAKLKMFKFDIDSVILDPEYKPNHSLSFENENFLTRFEVISDSIAVGAALEVLSYNSARVRLGKYNLISGKTEKFGYEHPKLKNEKTRAFFDYSHSQKRMALSYAFHDLITLFDLEGNLICNILGTKEFDNENGKLAFFSQVKITDKYIIASYRNKPKFRFDENKRPISNGSEILLFFDLKGNLIKVLDTGHEIDYFVADEENNLIFCSFLNREVPIGYFHYD
ncbi:BF3164 family lipoprotein [Belliella kenyensis]|uniref:BF3164 family lipoprotein n=1 Tax=Belliella kenyensis TaxID=1472724 RepID=A0ABV8EJV9_9BACT|nr:BF3164 family lipoprotein [Belliella kenyensis]MCH7402745.1 TolB-like 6-bladed beta-propeller domain-containing protein [Belliella kenyensis]MDN3603707.1 BF3164 family lipoprotein [Belliella kenyensis]